MNKPKYIAIAAVTIDGKIAKGPNHMSDWTSKEDKVFMRALLDKSDVIIVGNNTYKTAIKPLSKRNCIVFTRSANRLANKPMQFSPPFQGGARACPGLNPGGGYDYQKNQNLMYCDPKKTDIKKLTKQLNYKKIAILGGAQTYSYFLENNLLDEIYLTIEPLAFGGGINLFTNKKIGNFKFKLKNIKKLNRKGSILLKYVK
jgi:dihydrofolate reductase